MSQPPRKESWTTNGYRFCSSAAAAAADNDENDAVLMRLPVFHSVNQSLATPRLTSVMIHDNR